MPPKRIECDGDHSEAMPTKRPGSQSSVAGTGRARARLHGDCGAGARVRADGRRRHRDAGWRLGGATSAPSYCKSRIEYLARLRGAVPPRRNRSTGCLRGDATLHLRKQRNYTQTMTALNAWVVALCCPHCGTSRRSRAWSRCRKRSTNWPDVSRLSGRYWRGARRPRTSAPRGAHLRASVLAFSEAIIPWVAKSVLN